jgi:signal peptidase I
MIDTSKKRKTNRTDRHIFTSITAAVIVMLGIKLFFVDIMTVQGSSMQPTLRSGALLVVNRMAYGFQLPISNDYLFFWGEPEKGEIIVFNDIPPYKTYVKRCIAIPGDAFGVHGYQHNAPTPVVPQNHFFVVGDNYLYSHDSRDFGLVQRQQIKGKVIFSLGARAMQ